MDDPYAKRWIHATIDLSVDGNFGFSEDVVTIDWLVNSFDCFNGTTEQIPDFLSFTATERLSSALLETPTRAHLDDFNSGSSQNM